MRRKSISNAEGHEAHAADEISAIWYEHRETALSALGTLREPDIFMANASVANIWAIRIEATLDNYQGDGEAASQPLHSDRLPANLLQPPMVGDVTD